MKIDFQDTTDLTSQLTITIEPTDYKADFDKELKTYQKNVQMKGFRKGKTPITALKKMYGKAVLADVVNKKAEKTLQDYIVDNEIDILGNPLPAEDHEMIRFDTKEMSDYTYKFDIGRAPQLDITGADSATTYDAYKVTVADADIDEEITNLLKRMGEQKEVEGTVEENDIITLAIKEVAPVGETPYEAEISIMPDRMTDEYKSTFLGANIGDAVNVDIYKLEKDAKEDYVRKYFLKDAPEEVTADFATEIKTIKRLIPAEMDEEFFTKAFGEEGPKTEEEVRTKLREDLESFYETQANSITKRKILESLVEKNDMPLPDAFMKRWLTAANENITEEQLEAEYPSFVQNLKWTLIKQTIGKNNEIKIEADDIRTSMVDKFKAQFAQYGYGAGLGDLNFDDIGDRLMQNQESVQKEYEELLAERVLDQVKGDVTLQEKVISTEDYKEILKEFNS